MKPSQSVNRAAPLILSALVIAILLVSGLALAAAQGASDGRVNPVDHVGGAAVYCVDANFTPAHHWNQGGIRVLDGKGQVLLFAPAADITAAGDPPEATVLVGTGANAFGALTLYYRPDSKFQLEGTDEWDKAFTFVWGDCGYTAQAPVVPTAAPTITPEATCPPEEEEIELLAVIDDPCNWG